MAGVADSRNHKSFKRDDRVASRSSATSALAESHCPSETRHRAGRCSVQTKQPPLLVAFLLPPSPPPPVPVRRPPEVRVCGARALMADRGEGRGRGRSVGGGRGRGQGRGQSAGSDGGRGGSARPAQEQNGNGRRTGDHISAAEAVAAGRVGMAAVTWDPAVVAAAAGAGRAAQRSSSAPAQSPSEPRSRTGPWAQL